jgi:superfamily II DNA or RNA helicase
MPAKFRYEHQEEAIKELNAKKLDSRSLPFSGLIVIPTGGGKTRLAVRWLLSNVINRHKKVLWIAHRHQLLEQAYRAVRDDAYENVLPNRTNFRFHIISGQHDKPVNIGCEDEFIIASKDSLNKGMGHLLNNWLNYTDEVFLFIDEAHHAPAKTYRRIIETVREKSRVFRMLGVTATPFRTAQNEQGLLGELFKNDMIYGIDLQTLIDRDILAKPVFEELKTHLDMTKELTSADIKEIYAFDKLPERIARQIAESSERNKRIVTHYLQKQSEDGQLEYGQLLVFAINQIHAIHLNKLFNDELNKFFKTTGRIYSEYVIADVKDLNTGVNVVS